MLCFICWFLFLTESITVTSPYGSACGTHYLSSGEELDIHYYGRNFDGQCMIEVHSFGTKHLCVLAESMVIDNECSVKVKYYKGSSWTSSPEEVSMWVDPKVLRH